MQITYVGDAHGKWPMLKHIVERHSPHNPVVCVGDVGFWVPKDLERKFPDNFYFISGNHENSPVYRQSPHYLGRFGYNKRLNLFFISGAWSIDQNLRKEGVSWWRDEELDWQECQQCVELYNKIKPDYIITHECPQCISALLLAKIGNLGDRGIIKTKTGQLLEQLFQDHKPKVWIFGHWHLSYDQEILGTRFICLNELEEKTLDLNPNIV